MNEADQDEMIKFLLKQIEQRQAENAELASQVEELEDQLENLENQEQNNSSVSLSNFQHNRSVDQMFSEYFPFQRSSSVKPRTQNHIDTAIDKIFLFAKKDPKFS